MFRTGRLSIMRSLFAVHSAMVCHTGIVRNMFHARIKFVKLVHLVGFIISKFVTMHGDMNVKRVALRGARPENYRNTKRRTSSTKKSPTLLRDFRLPP
jgi:hypothetical protein